MADQRSGQFRNGTQWSAGEKRRRQHKGPLYERLKSIRPQIAEAAQQVYDEWEQDEEGFSDVYGGGGICDAISNAVSDVVSTYLLDVDLLDGGWEGDDHAWLIIRNEEEAYGLDIPCQIYETGGGYSWTKTPGVRISPKDVSIWWIDPEDLEED